MPIFKRRIFTRKVSYRLFQVNVGTFQKCKNAHACALRDCLGVSRPFVSDTSPKCIDREGLERRRTGTRQPKTENESSQNNSLVNETVIAGEGNSSLFQEQESSSSVTNVTTGNDTGQARNTINFKPLKSSAKSSEPSNYIDDVFETHSTPSSDTFDNKYKTNSKKHSLKSPKKARTKSINLSHRRTPHNKILHVEA